MDFQQAYSSTKTVHPLVRSGADLLEQTSGWYHADRN
jgi:hypothetical protein